MGWTRFTFYTGLKKKKNNQSSGCFITILQFVYQLVVVSNIADVN